LVVADAGIRLVARKMMIPVAKSPDVPTLLFFTSATSGPARRMESLLAVIERRERGKLRVVPVDADASRALADAFGVTELPTLVLLRDRRAVARIEGRATGPQVDAMISAHAPDGDETLGILYRLRTAWEARRNEPASLKAIEQLIGEYEAKAEAKG
jgi:thioredoxin-like negative regulator of GroEL